MPQVQLPIFPAGVTHINSEVAFEERDGKVYYFNGHLPVFVHEKSALATFRLFSTQLIINGNATQAEISRAFGVPLVTVKRYAPLTARLLQPYRADSKLQDHKRTQLDRLYQKILDDLDELLHAVGLKAA